MGRVLSRITDQVGDPLIQVKSLLGSVSALRLKTIIFLIRDFARSMPSQ